MDYRSRLIAFYTHYAPEKVSGVGVQLSKYEGREEDLIQALVDKYGPEPDSAGEKNKDGANVQQDEWYAYYRQRLVNFYTTYAPEKLNSVDAQLTKYAGREETFFEALVKKYGPEVQYEDCDENGAEVNKNDNSSYRSRVVAIYEQYAPAKLGNVDTQLEKYRGQEEALIAALERKYVYGTGSSVSAFSVSERPPASNVASNRDYRGRVVAIYEKYAPAKLASVDTQLEKYRGQEEALIAALVSKYGPEPSVAGTTLSDYRSRVVAIYEQYAPAKLGNVDTQLEKYRGQEEALIAALERKYVYGTGSSVSAFSVSERPPASNVASNRDYRGRVVAIYEKYAPAKLASVDTQLEKYRGQEEALIAALVSKYGPEPSVAGTTLSDYRSRVVAIYEQYAPAKLGNVDTQLEKYRGQEEALIAALERKYVYGTGSSVSAFSVSERPPASNVASNRDYRDRLVALYEQYAPAKLGNVDTQLEKYRGQEEALIAALVNKYGPEPSVAGDDVSDFRSRVVAIYERYAPAKLGNVDTQLEKYRGQEEALIAALERKYVYGTGSSVSAFSVSERPSVIGSQSAGDLKESSSTKVIIALSGEESSGRLELLELWGAKFNEFCVYLEDTVRCDLEQKECVSFLCIFEESDRLFLVVEEKLSCPVVEHPPFPFVGENGDVLMQFFEALGTTDVQGEPFISPVVCRLLFLNAIGGELAEMPQGELISFSEFRRVLTCACYNEADVVTRMLTFMSNEKRSRRVMRLTSFRELRTGFWAHFCIKPCITESWKCVWVVLEDDNRLVLLRPNVMKPELTVAVSRVLNCRLTSMLGTKAPRSCAKNGLYLQLSLDTNPVLLLMCSQRVEHAHALVKFFREGAKKSALTRASGGVVATITESGETSREDEKKRNADGDTIFRPAVSSCTTKVWCCRGGCSEFVRSVWTLVGSYIVHHIEGKSTNYLWNLTTVKDVYVANELAVKPPAFGPKFFFVVICEKGSLFCCTETLAARDTLVTGIKRVMFILFLQANKPFSSTFTTSTAEDYVYSYNAMHLAEAPQRVPGFLPSMSR